MEEIKVHVNDYGNGRNLVMLFVDLVSGKRVTKSTGTTDPGTAERAAGEWEKELRSGLYKSPSKITWAEFREKYENEKLSGLAPGTGEVARASFNHIERILAPDRLCKMTAPVLSKFQSALRKEGWKETTIAKNLRHIKAALRWAENVGLMPKAPRIEMPKRNKGQPLARARAITLEELERMIAACDKVRPKDAQLWKQYLYGLWYSGLRLRESLLLSWDTDTGLSIDLTGKRPVLRIYAENQKSRRDEILPLCPDFCQWLLQTFPESERQGRVLKLSDTRTGKPMNPTRVIRTVSQIGKKAKVVTNKADGKHATAHDLRRAFCTRWASRVKPAVLQKLARHSEISTTLKYYTTLDAEDIAEELWAGFGQKTDNNTAIYNKPYNTCP
jgi:integrase